MSAMEKAQTADPGILWKQKWVNIGDMSRDIRGRLFFRTADAAHLFICVVKTPTTEGTPLMLMMSVMD